jgi:hypothetical protein
MGADGSQHTLYMTHEDAYGTLHASPVWDQIREKGTTLALSKDTLVSEEITALRQTADVRHGARKVGGNIDMELSYTSFDVMLEALLGGTWTNDVLKVGTTRRSFSMMRKFADMTNPYHVFTGVEFNNLQLNIPANAMVTGTFGVLGKEAVAPAAAAPTSSTYNTVSATSPMDSFSGVLTEGGSAIALITEVQLTIDNGMEPRFVVGSKTSLRPSQGRCSVSGQASVFFEDDTMLNKFLNETVSAMTISLPDTAGNTTLITIPRVKYNGGQPDVKGEGPIILAMPFLGLMDSVSSTSVQFTRTAHV